MDDTDFPDMNDPDVLQDMAESGSLEYSHSEGGEYLGDGFSVEGENDFSSEDDALADAFFASMTETRDIQKGDQHVIAEGYRGQSVAGAKQHQMEHLSPTVKKIISDATQGKMPEGKYVDNAVWQAAVNTMSGDVEGNAAGVLDGVKLTPSMMPSKVNKVSPSLYADYTVSGLEVETKYGTTKHVKDISGQMRDNAPSVTYDYSFEARPSQQDLNLALGHMTRTDIYLEKGAGSSLAPGVVRNSDTLSAASQELQETEQARLNTELAQAMKWAKELAGDALSAENQASKIGELTLERATSTFINHALNGSGREGSSRLLLLPNEYNIPFGTKDTANISGTWEGSPYTREQFAKAGIDDKDPRYWTSRPSVKESLYGGKGVDPLARDHNYDQALYKAHYVQRVLKEQMPEHRNESEGEGRYVRGQDPLDETQRESMQRWGESALLDLDGQPTAGDIDFDGFGRNAGRTRFGEGQDGDITGGAAGQSSAGQIAETFDRVQHFVQFGEYADDQRETQATAAGGSARPVPLDGAQDVMSQSQYYKEAMDAGATQAEAYEFAQAGGDQSIEQYMSRRVDAYSDSMSAREEYLWNVRQNKPPEQGSQEWLNLRKGKLTASIAAQMMTKYGVETAARNLLEDKLDPTGNLGYRSSGNKVFEGNTFSARGNAGEEAAKQKFLKKNRGIKAEDAFFEENPLYPGMGASPDARLYHPDGSSAGLLELKVLKTGRIPGAMDRYTAQMQLQMLVTGETQTTLFAVDSATGETTQDIMYADEEYQQELIERHEEVRNLLGGVPESVEGVLQLREFNKAKGGLAAKQAAAAGQAARYNPQPDTPQEAAMTAWKAGTGPRTQGQQWDAAARHVGSRTTEEQAGDVMTEMYRIRQDDAAKLSAKGITEQPASDSSVSTEELNQAHADALQHAQDRIQAEGEASDSVREFSESLSQAKESAKSWAGAVDDAFKLIREGTASGMDTIRLAAEIGQGADETRGSQWAMRQGGVDEKDANRLLMAAGGMQAKFNNEGTAAAEFTRIKAEFGKSEGLRGRFDSVQYEQMQSMSPSQLLDFADKDSRDLSPELRAQYMKVFGFEELSAYDGRGGSLTQSMTVETEKFRQTNLGVEDAQRGQQILQEATVTKLTGDETSYNKGLAAATNEILNSYKSTSGALMKLATAAGAAGLVLGGKAGDAGLLDGIRSATLDNIIANEEVARDSMGNIMPPNAIGGIPSRAAEAKDKAKVELTTNVNIERDGSYNVSTESNQGDMDTVNGNFKPND